MLHLLLHCLCFGIRFIQGESLSVDLRVIGSGKERNSVEEQQVHRAIL